MKKFILSFACLVFCFTCATIEIQASRSEELEIKGIVIDESGERLIGATIIQDGTSNGTTSNAEGRFTLRCHGPHVPGPNNSYGGYRIVASMTGYETNSTVVPGEPGSTVSVIFIMHEDAE